MGYNGGNRRMRSSMFSKRNMNYGSKALGNKFVGLLGAGVMVGKVIGAAIEEGTRNEEIEQKQKAKETEQQDKEQCKKRSVWEWISIILLWICGFVLFAIALYYIGRLAIGLMIGLALLSKK